VTNATDQVTGDLAIARDPRARLEDRIAAGARLWNLINEAESALAPLKMVLRDEARARLGSDPGSIHLEGSGMTRAVVTVPKPSYAVAKGTDMIAVKQLLGAAFDLFFEEITTYKVRGVPNTGKIASLNPEDRNTALSAICQVDPTPRVSFKSAGEGVEQISG
jgi:hypothetical protein